MIGALVFLGCPLRMVIRMSAGDLNAWVAFVGFILGVATGVFALKKGFSLGRAHVTNKVNGAVLPAIVVAILILATCTTLLKASQAGPGSMHAPIIASLIGGLVFGAFAQKSRMCFAGSIRDIILMKNFDLISVIAGLFVLIITQCFMMLFRVSMDVRLLSIVALLIFTGITVWDVQRMNRLLIQSDGSVVAQDKIAIFMALQLYLDFLNIFLRILQLIGMGNRNNK